MPVSTAVHISHCIQYIVSQNPSSILDVGLGFGMWGFLCRTYLDVFPGRVQPEAWQVRIDGIEFWAPYIQAHQRCLYDKIIIGDVRELAAQIDQYDLIIAGDVIEHLEKDDGEIVLDALYGKARQALLINLPLGPGWDHPEQHGNPQELHRSVWEVEDLEAYPSMTQIFRLPTADYGVFWCPKDCPRESRFVGLFSMAVKRQEQGNVRMARLYAERANALEPCHAPCAMLYADTLVQQDERRAAVAVFERLTQANPGFDEGHVLLARQLKALGRGAEAALLLQRLLVKEDLAQDLRRQAEELLSAW